MMQHPESEGRDEESKRKIRLLELAQDLYNSTEDYCSAEAEQTDYDEVCPLFNSMLQIEERYQSPELIGQGGMKQVFRVFDEKTSRHVALAKPTEKHTKDHFDSFLREAKLTARLSHPSIIEVFDIGIDNQHRPFFTMEFKSGRSLRDLISSLRRDSDAQQPPLRRRLEIFLRICEAIAYAHSRRVLHLDIKPSNIQIGEFGEVKVCDWGLGVVMPSDDSTNTSTALLDPDLYGPLLIHAKGTPDYMAPEQLDQLHPKTPQMDIYALGCVLNELVTGHKHQSKFRVKNIPSALPAIIRKAVAVAPSDRYQSATELQADLLLFMSDYSTSVEGLSLIREANLYWKRHREACLVWLGASLLLCGFLLYFIFQLANKEHLAIVAKDKAEAAKHEAVGLLFKYQQKDTESQRRMRRLRASQAEIQLILMQKNQLSSSIDLEQGLDRSNQILSNLIEENPSPGADAWKLLCRWNLVAQDLDAANKLVEEGKSLPHDFAAASKRFAPLLNSEGFLETKDMISFLRLLKNRPILCHRALAFDQLNPRADEHRGEIAKAWLTMYARNKKEIRLSYNSNSKQVRLQGPVKRLTKNILIKGDQYKLNYLQNLNPLVLDIRGTNINSLDELQGLNPTEVNIRQTPITNLTPLSNYRSIKRVIVEEGQFSEMQLKKQVPRWVEVVLKGQEHDR